MKLCILIPLYNEEENILPLLEKLHRVPYPDFVEKVEIVIVDDCSVDASWEVVSSTGFKNLILFRQEKNMGKGAAVKKAFELADGDVYLIQDADLELDPRDIPRMLLTMKELDVQFVNGSRYLPGLSRPLSSYRRYLANRFFTFMTSVLINVKLTDMACGYKLIQKDLMNKIHLRENRFGFEAELILKALRIKRNNITEVPVNYFPRNAGEGKKLRNTDAFKILWTILKYGLFRLK